MATGTTRADLEALRAPWDELLESSSCESCFLSWDWLSTWWDVFGKTECELFVLDVRDGERLVGLAPFVFRRERRLRILPTRTIRILGTGEPEWEEVASVYPDLIAAPGYEDGVAAGVWEWLAARSDRWDEIRFEDVLGGSLLRTRLVPLAARAGHPTQVRPCAVRFRIDLPGAVEEYRTLLGKRTRKRVAANRRHFESAGVLEERVVTSRSELDEAFRSLIELHGKRWRGKGLRGVFASPRFTEFHRRLLPRLLELGRLDLRRVFLNGVAIAALYNIRFKGAMNAYQGGFDFDRWSPGTLSDVLGIESAIREGLSRYDFLKGSPDSYKAGYGAATEPLYEIRVFGRFFAGKLLAAGGRARAWVRSWRGGEDA